MLRVARGIILLRYTRIKMCKKDNRKIDNSEYNRKLYVLKFYVSIKSEYLFQTKILIVEISLSELKINFIIITNFIIYNKRIFFLLFSLTSASTQFK